MYSSGGATAWLDAAGRNRGAVLCMKRLRIRFAHDSVLGSFVHKPRVRVEGVLDFANVSDLRARLRDAIMIWREYWKLRIQLNLESLVEGSYFPN